MREVRCKKCGQLMAVICDNGLIECKIGRRVIWTERALLSCLKCGGEILVDAGREDGKAGGLDKTIFLP